MVWDRKNMREKLKNLDYEVVGWDITGVCKDCNNRRVCVLFDGVYRTKAVTLSGEYKAEVLECKWYVKEESKDDK